MVDQMLQAVSGLDEVGYDSFSRLSDQEVGAIVKNRARQGAAARPAAAVAAGQPGSFVRGTRELNRRAPAGFPTFSLAAAIGATSQQSITLSRPADITRLVIVPSAAGVVMDSMKIGDEEQLLNSGVPVELFAANVVDPRSDNFTTLPSGIPLTILLRNTTAGAITANIGFKAEVQR
jgi:hypothetical protein